MKGTLALEELDAAGIDTVIVAGVDMYGGLAGKRMPVRTFRHAVCDGVNMCSCVYAWDVRQNSASLRVDYAGAHTGWHDFRLQPDLATLRLAAWLDRTAICLADSVDARTGEPLPIAPRTILRRQVDQLRAAGMTASTASELEFHLYRGDPHTLRRTGLRELEPTTLTRSDYSIGPGNAMQPFFGQLQAALEDSAIPVGMAQAEYGLGQWEINLEHTDAVEMADRHVLFKTAVRDLAAAHGLTATFMARPAADTTGSSCHVHVSVRGVGGSYPFYDRDAERTVGRPLRAAVGGVLDRAVDLLLWYAPTVNSMRRILCEEFAGNGLSWGFDNRTTTCRVITGGPTTNRLELRLPGADVNPYLALAAVLASVRDGVRRDTDPGEPCLGDAYAQVQAALPATLGEAADLFERSAFAAAMFGKDVVKHYAAVGRNEWHQFLRAVTDWERDRYLDVI